MKWTNFNIVNNDHGNNNLFILNNRSSLNFKKAFFQNNTGSQPLFYIGIHASLSLENVTFEKNISTSTMTSIIFSAQDSNINLINCNFLQHTSDHYTNSMALIKGLGHLDITSCKFYDNNTTKSEALFMIRMEVI